MSNNFVNIVGIVDNIPELNHTFYDDKYYIFYVLVNRLSGNVDRLPVVFNSKKTDVTQIVSGKTVSIKGDYRSFNAHDNSSTHLLLNVFANSVEIIEDASNTHVNEITLNGYLCKPPIFRKTPLNRTVCDILLAVNRKSQKSDYIPCILWGKHAELCKNLSVGTNLNLTGRIQSRVYQKKTDSESYTTKTAYEISATNISLINKDD